MAEFGDQTACPPPPPPRRQGRQAVYTPLFPRVTRSANQASDLGIQQHQSGNRLYRGNQMADRQLLGIVALPPFTPGAL